MSETYRTAPVPCPMCATELNRTTTTDDDYPPRPGDVTVCASCGAVLAFTDTMSLAPAPEEAVRQCQDQLAKAQEILRIARKHGIF